jgi:hypothetical protein
MEAGQRIDADAGAHPAADHRPREDRDLAAAQAFFRSAKAVTGITPDRVTTDGHDAYPSNPNVAAILRNAHHAGVDFDPFPNAEAWLRACLHRPAAAQKARQL